LAYWSHGYYYRDRLRYVGDGEMAVLVAELDGLERVQAIAERDRARELEQAERQAFQAARRQSARVDALVKVELEALGYHRLRRHHWRRRRATMPTSEIQSQVVETATLELAKLAEFVLIEAVAKGNDETYDKLSNKLQALRLELGGNDPSPALRIVVEAAVLCWAHHWLTELAAAGRPLTVSQELDRHRTWAQRRFLSALTTVERIRRLGRPKGPKVAIQVNQMMAPPEPCLALAQ